ncbi:MAG: oxidoreductase [Eggerthellaceae bacterium]|nr:oxidoreductase [Eggerthellaceae bacterium]
MQTEGIGLLINYQYCTGCHSCEVACRKKNDIPLGKWGIKLNEVGPFKLDEDPDHTTWEFDYVPVPTSLCDLCEDRLAQGLKPVCEIDCQALVIEHGTLEELAARARELGPKTAIYLP